MALQAQLFRGDPKLEAAAVSDPSHVVPGANGEHIRKIQQALIQLDGAAIDANGKYGPATAAAVLAYKRKRNIINRSYQTKADNIVGKMTMAALDREMRAKENVPPVPGIGARFVRANPSDLSDGFHDGASNFGPSVRPTQLVALGLQPSKGLLPGAPFSTPTLIVTQGVISFVNLLNGFGNEVLLDPSDPDGSSVAQIVDPFGKPGSGPVKVDANSIRIQGGTKLGFTRVLARDSSGADVALLQVLNLSRIEKTVSSTYLKKPSGVATSRNPGDETAMLFRANQLYNRQTGIFFNAVVQPNRKNFDIPEFGNATEVVLDTTPGKGDTPDKLKIYPKHRDHSADFNVFFVKNIKDLAGGFPGGITTVVVRSRDFRNSIVADRSTVKLVFIQSDGQLLAHELGHALGQHHNQDPTSLMTENASTGVDISVDMALQMRNNLQRFPQK